MIALAVPDVDRPTMADKAVAINRALPSPQPPRKPTIWPIVSENPPSAEKMMMSKMPVSNVFLMPIRLEMTPVMSMATPVTRL